LSATQKVSDKIIRHQIDLLQYSNTTARELRAVLKRTLKDINKRILSASTEFQIARFGRMQEELRVMIAEMDTPGIISKAVSDIATTETAFMGGLYTSAVTVELATITPEVAIASATSIPTSLISGKKVQTKTIAQLVRTYDAALERQLLPVLQSGIIEGRPVKEIAKELSRVSGTKLDHNAMSLARTANIHTGSVARQQFYEANRKVIIGERFLATLDIETTPACAGFDGELFLIGGGPIPPLHYRCRSIRAGVVNPKFGLSNITGNRPQRGAEGPGVTKSTTTFNSFFSRQPEAWQRRYLGPKRFELYKKGNLHIREFTDNKGSLLSVKQVAENNDIIIGE
jgi:SPP1 gp7 family putative phage head morphogenesis protein